MSRIDQAVIFLTNSMLDKKRKDGRPAVFHSLEVGVIASTITRDEDTIIAALLHDVVEDAGIKITTIQQMFGDRCAELVQSETEDKRADMPPEQTWKIRKQEAIDSLRERKDIGVETIFLADKLSNIRSVVQGLKECGDAYWQRFHQKDPKEHEWYYREVAKLLPDLESTYVFKEYQQLIRVAFEEKKYE